MGTISIISPRTCADTASNSANPSLYADSIGEVDEGLSDLEEILTQEQPDICPYLLAWDSDLHGDSRSCGQLEEAPPPANPPADEPTASGPARLDLTTYISAWVPWSSANPAAAASQTHGNFYSDGNGYQETPLHVSSPPSSHCNNAADLKQEAAAPAVSDQPPLQQSSTSSSGGNPWSFFGLTFGSHRDNQQQHHQQGEGQPEEQQQPDRRQDQQREGCSQDHQQQGEVLHRQQSEELHAQEQQHEDKQHQQHRMQEQLQKGQQQQQEEQQGGTQEQHQANTRQQQQQQPCAQLEGEQQQQPPHEEKEDEQHQHLDMQKQLREEQHQQQGGLEEQQQQHKPCSPQDPLEDEQQQEEPEQERHSGTVLREQQREQQSQQAGSVATAAAPGSQWLQLWLPSAPTLWLPYSSWTQAGQMEGAATSANEHQPDQQQELLKGQLHAPEKQQKQHEASGTEAGSAEVEKQQLNPTGSSSGRISLPGVAAAAAVGALAGGAVAGPLGFAAGMY